MAEEVGVFLGLLYFLWFFSEHAREEEDDEGEENEKEESNTGWCMLISRTSLFGFLCVVLWLLFLSLPSSPEESESVASWSVIMIRRSFLLGFLFVLIDGLSSKIELGVSIFSF